MLDVSLDTAALAALYGLPGAEPDGHLRADLYAAQTLDALYGVDAMRTFSLYGINPHCSCNPMEFCRNPLHPGPCAGWKKTLKAVAPGVHDMIEKDRLEKVAARRKAREDAKLPGGGKGKRGKGKIDGDGDGKIGEDDSKKDPKKPRRKKKDEEEKDPSEGRPVKISKETRALVAAARRALPKDDDGWRELSQEKVQVAEPSINKLLRAAQTRLADNVIARDGARNRHASRIRPGMGWQELLQRDPDEARWFEDHDGKYYNQELREAEEALDLVSDAVAKGNADIQRLGGLKPDGTVPDGFVPEPGFRASSFEQQATWQRRQYPRDTNSRALPPPELAAMHEKVQKAGAAVNADLKKSMEADADLKKARAELVTAKNKAWDYSLPVIERDEARQASKRLQTQVAQRERELVMDALSQLRPMGGKKHDSATPVKARSEIVGMPGRPEDIKLARKDWQQSLDATTAHMPDAWVERSNQSPMQVVSTERAWHMDYGDWRDPSRARSILAMNTDKGAANASYDGAFGSYVDEVTYHEYGHRMEQQIPGIKALEFAYVRSKTTHNGVVEQSVDLKDLYGGGYAKGELAFKDNFANAYTGKTYEDYSGDPMNSSWEAFQVGLQQTVGRGSRKFGDDSLEDFVLGVMSTVGAS